MFRVIATLLIVFLFVQCGTEDLSIRKNQLGSIDKNTTLEELDALFKSDSIEKYPEGELTREYRVFDVSGEPKLVFQPKVENDSIKSLELVKIYSSLYSTEKGISTASTFGDIAELYTIDKIEPTFSSAVLFVDELDMTISLVKSDLKIDEFDMRDIQKEQIPDLARVRYITLWLD